MNRWRGGIALSNILDGTSNTLMIGEKHIRYITTPGTNEDGSVYRSGGTVSGSLTHSPHSRLAGRQLVGLTTTPVPNGRLYVLQIYDPNPVWNLNRVSDESFGSRHPGVCQFVLADGSVRALKNNINLDTLTWLAARQDGQVVGDF